MLRRNLILVLGVILLFSSNGGAAKAMDPAFGFLYGYSLGQTNQFRNRLPAPPYFAVHPPVYYGERVYRPYGESPFASWPLLSAGSDYRVQNPSRIVTHRNPYIVQATVVGDGIRVEETSPAFPSSSDAEDASTEEKAEGNDSTEGKMVTVMNPFVVSTSPIASK